MGIRFFRRRIVNCLIAPPRNILTYLLTYLRRIAITLRGHDVITAEICSGRCENPIIIRYSGNAGCIYCVSRKLDPLRLMTISPIHNVILLFLVERDVI